MLSLISRIASISAFVGYMLVWFVFWVLLPVAGVVLLWRVIFA